MTRKDAVTPQLRLKILRRDGMCFIYRNVDVKHVCFNAFGLRHAPTDILQLTLDHVHDEGGMMGKRAPSDERHLVAMCAAANVAGPSRDVRAREREYLRSLYDRA